MDRWHLHVYGTLNDEARAELSRDRFALIGEGGYSSTGADQAGPPAQPAVPTFDVQVEADTEADAKQLLEAALSTAGVPSTIASARAI